MTEDPNLIAIKQREQAIRDAIAQGEPLIDLKVMGGIQFTVAQMRLQSLYGDAGGRIWRLHDGRLYKVFDPAWLPREPLDIAL